MSRIAKHQVHAALERAAQHLKDAAGADGRVSRADIQAKVGALGSPTQKTEQALVDVFYKFIDHRDAGAGAQVTARDVDRAVAYAKDRMIDAYDLNHNGLSQAEISRMSLTGQLAVSLARELKAAAAAVSAGAAQGADGELPRTELFERTAAFIVDNASSTARLENGELFPAIDVSNQGLFAHILEGEGAERLVELALLARPDKAEAFADFDPARHDVLAVRVTFDEENVIVSLVDRQTGAITEGARLWLAEFEPAAVDRAVLERIFGPLSSFGADGWEDLQDSESMAMALMRGGVLLDIGKERDRRVWEWDAPVVDAATAMAERWGDENIMNGEAHIEAKRMPVTCDRGAAAVEILVDELCGYKVEVQGRPEASRPQAFDPGQLTAVAERVNWAFQLAGDDQVERFAGQIRDVVVGLGDPADLSYVVAKGRLVDPFVDEDRALRAETHLFVNEKTGMYAAFSLREGTNAS